MHPPDMQELHGGMCIAIAICVLSGTVVRTSQAEVLNVFYVASWMLLSDKRTKSVDT